MGAMKNGSKVGDKLKVKNAVVMLFTYTLIRAKIQFVFKRNRKAELYR